MTTPMTPIPFPLSSIENKLDPLDRTPVGDRDKGPKIQLCIELREKEVIRRKTSKKKVSHELVLEIAVLFIKNLPRRKLAGNSGAPGAFVKVRFGNVIHSTELKMDKKNDEKVDFIEVFQFPLAKVEDVQGKTMEVLVCDKKLTRNSTVFGEATINVDDVFLGKPICKWYNLDPSAAMPS
ncbi:Protein piccolo [Orchesella cincta]|uniref:Protein piccolo n=1 Tax=Orchesella cincta TaxID=48709 RepID=A0A1D2MIP1_ORCCI|nr:Protein piccolo [Orchesella cincta]